MQTKKEKEIHEGRLRGMRNVGEDVIDNIINILYNKYNGITKPELKRVIMSQFKMLNAEINSKGTREVKLMYLGTFKPTKPHLRRTAKRLARSSSKGNLSNNTEVITSAQE